MIPLKEFAARTWALLICVCVISFADACTAQEQADYPIKPVPGKDVTVESGFWAERIETNRRTTIPYCLEQCRQSGRIDNFAIAGGLKKGVHKGHYFNDSDVFKVIEGAAYSLGIYPDAELEKQIDAIILKIAAAQEDDGYLYTVRTVNPAKVPEPSGNERWSNLRYSHELYNLGHLYEAAVAYYQATGKRGLLDVAIKSAGLLRRTFGPDKKQDTSGHEEVEIGLVRLYRATGKKKYLDLAKFFINQRGNHTARQSYKDFRQDHKPFAEQSEALGHAVSGAYLYCGAADVAALTGDAEYVKALDRIWADVVSKKMYITGVAAARGEKFSSAYQLPNLKGYNETCAAIAFAMWNHRMFLLHGESKYMDLVERSLHNGISAGVSLRGDEFFYSNPLESDGKHKFNGIDVPDEQLTASRWPWFLCACCPSNVARAMPSVVSYAYAHKDRTIYINLYMAGRARIKTANQSIALTVDTKYPWDGAVKITVEPEKDSAEFAMNLRIPGWVRDMASPTGLYRYFDRSGWNVQVRVNGQEAALSWDGGYARILRRWNKGDIIELNLPMRVRRIVCDEKVESNRGKVALERGPIVYCVEWFDNGGKVSHLSVSDDDRFSVEYRKDALGGINVLSRIGEPMLAIPYYTWAHRGEGQMKVWLDRKMGDE